jgi:branched-chain amino acid transport system ATP-binding protein
MLEVDALDVGYGPLTVLRGVSLRVDEGEMVAVVGPNGAGKSTLLRGITGLAAVQGGRVRFEGSDITGWKTPAIARAGLSHVLEDRGLFAPMTVGENLRLGAYCSPKGSKGSDRYELVRELFPILHDRRNQAAGNLSGGEQKMLAIARALMSQPRMLLLDEPSAGLAPLVVKRLYEAVGELHADGLSVLIVEQNVRVALDVAQRGYVISVGRIEVEGAAAELRDDPHVQELYLGGGAPSASGGS